MAFSSKRFTSSACVFARSDQLRLRVNGVITEHFHNNQNEIE